MSTDIETWKATIEEQMTSLRALITADTDWRKAQADKEQAEFAERKAAHAKQDAERYASHVERCELQNALLERIAVALERQ